VFASRLHQNFNLVNHDKPVTPPHITIQPKQFSSWLPKPAILFDPEEHDVATGCPKERIVKFTGVPGVRSGYQLPMKPVVYTVTETDSMSQARGAVTEDHSTLVAQPSPLEANMGGREGSEFSSISNPT